MKAPLWGSAIFMMVIVGSAFSTPSGLNNIPTADVTEQGVLVLQQMNNLRVGGFDGRHVFACKFGVAPNAEIGWVGAPAHSSSRRDFLLGVGAAASYPTTFHGKVRVPIRQDLQWAVGIVNLSDSSRKAGHPVYYTVLSRTTQWARVHVGFMATRGPDGVFIGLDKTVGRWTWRVDFNDVGPGAVYTVGFLTPLSRSWVWESWLSIPTQRGLRNTLTVKFNYVVKRW